MTKSESFPWLQCFRGTFPFTANKNESERRRSATIAILRTEGGWLCVGGKINTSVRSSVPRELTFLLSPHGYQPKMCCQNLALTELSQWNIVLLGDFLLPRCLLFFFIFFFFNSPQKTNQVAPSRVEISLQIHYCNLQMIFTLYAPDNNCINISR